MLRTDIEARVRVEIEALAGRRIPDADAELYASAIMDSMNVLHVIVFCEDTFGISVDPFDVNLQALDSIAKITDFVVRKREG